MAREFGYRRRSAASGESLRAAPEGALRPRLNPRHREPTEKEIRDALRIPSDFGYSGDLPIGETWSIGPVIRTRDSQLRELSNANALEKALAKVQEFDDEYAIVSANHWAVGWVDHLAFRVIGDDGQPTEIFKWLLSWFDALSDYPVADDDDYSEREYEAVMENIRDAGHRIKEGGPVEEMGWEESVREWLEEHGSHQARRSLEDPENYGMDPADVEKALRALGLFRADEKFAIRLVPTDDDPFMVTVYTSDRQAALEDQSIEGSMWEAPFDLDEAYAIISNTKDLPTRLRREGYIVDDSEWFWPPAGSPGQQEMNLSWRVTPPGFPGLRRNSPERASVSKPIIRTDKELLKAHASQISRWYRELHAWVRDQPSDQQWQYGGDLRRYIVAARVAKEEKDR